METTEFDKVPNTPGTDEYNLHRRWRSMRFDLPKGWETFEKFYKWAMEAGYFKGAFLRQYDEGRGHGPGNSYWSASPGGEMWGKTTDRPQAEPGDWREEYIKNWNKNIHRDVPAELLSKPQRECFRYEHPDLEREGICFTLDT